MTIVGWLSRLKCAAFLGICIFDFRMGQIGHDGHISRSLSPHTLTERIKCTEFLLLVDSLPMAAPYMSLSYRLKWSKTSHRSMTIVSIIICYIDNPINIQNKKKTHTPVYQQIPVHTMYLGIVVQPIQINNT